MTSLKIHSIESAPEDSKAPLEQSLKTNGMIPGLHGVLAGSPSLLKAYQHLHDLFTKSSLNKEELTVVWQTINVEHECHYCVPAHTGIAHMMNVDPSLTEALRNRSEMPTKKLQALQDMTLKMLKNRGQVSQEDLDAFYEVGYGEQQILDIILGLAQKTISNYTNHIANTPVDEPFQKYEWSK
jgi:alkylhydroperoxidase family enzyme